jgi:hypothetical protein
MQRGRLRSPPRPPCASTRPRAGADGGFTPRAGVHPQPPSERGCSRASRWWAAERVIPRRSPICDQGLPDALRSSSRASSAAASSARSWSRAARRSRRVRARSVASRAASTRAFSSWAAVGGRRVASPADLRPERAAGGGRCAARSWRLGEGFTRAERTAQLDSRKGASSEAGHALRRAGERADPLPRSAGRGSVALIPEVMDEAP